MIGVRAARPNDAAVIGAIHVAAWRSTYPGILPDDYLAGLSVVRQSFGYRRAIEAGAGVFVAAVAGTDSPDGRARVVGFATCGPARRPGLGDAEVETLYVLDDYRDRGVGRRLMRACARHMMEQGARSGHVWVLRDNPARWFYLRLGGMEAAADTVRIAGRTVPQTAFIWRDLAHLLAPASSRPSPDRSE
jgi:hypothetical protein